MTKEEKLKIIKELNDCFDEVVEPYLERLEKAEDEEAKACNNEKRLFTSCYHGQRHTRNG